MKKGLTSEHRNVFWRVRHNPNTIQVPVQDCGPRWMLHSRVPTRSGKPGNLGKLFPVKEKSGKMAILAKFWKSQGK